MAKRAAKSRSKAVTPRVRKHRVYNYVHKEGRRERGLYIAPEVLAAVEAEAANDRMSVNWWLEEHLSMMLGVKLELKRTKNPPLPKWGERS